MKTSQRRLLKTIGEKLGDPDMYGHPQVHRHSKKLWLDYVYRNVNKTELRAIATMLDRMADYWVAHPEKWMTGNEHNDNFTQFCNVGLVTQHKIKVAKSISDMDAYADFVIDLNDDFCKDDLAVNIEGLRLSAKAMRLTAKGFAFPVAVKKAFANNAHLLQVQEARRASKMQRRPDFSIAL